MPIILKKYSCLYKEGDGYYYLFTDDFKARVLEYVKTFR